jgi:hypothetical protein
MSRLGSLCWKLTGPEIASMSFGVSSDAWKATAASTLGALEVESSAVYRPPFGGRVCGGGGGGWEGREGEGCRVGRGA